MSKSNVFLIRIAWVLYSLILFAATHVPVPRELEEVVSTFDKIIHASAFFVLAVLTILSLPARRPSVWLLCGLLMYAALDEFLQRFVNRTPDLVDWFSDAAGIVAAFILMRLLMWRNGTLRVQEEV
ncbi:VanZ family protein [Planctomicrobium sp. SH661]|uniref:VanZ family protein n=1 Tax=Planctomicrobium sp. SH661 TaxID=3448124 RepID=UPI003F5AFE9E